MFDYIISEEAKKHKERVRAFVRDEISPSLLKQMDQNEIQYPTEYLKKLGEHNLICCRVPKEYGGRGLNWECEVVGLEEIGVLGSSLPLIPFFFGGTLTLIHFIFSYIILAGLLIYLGVFLGQISGGGRLRYAMHLITAGIVTLIVSILLGI